ncbi:MAG: cytochrome b N-terminal domain-containing protein [Candidatus Eremiobacteraeota bacterium]|nr:cytochrome b N-terminal domain-containing protein [Candidatus Eremiobacteraeota bacterium]
MLTWIEKRTGVLSLIQNFLTEDVPGGASYWYVFGSATLFAMIIQIVTGIFLTFFYAPSAATAWESTKAMVDSPFQHFVLSLHYWGASAMIALVALHLLQTLVWGAYKAPREIQWIVGVLLFIITLVLGLTGYLLPWDLNAYFASQVAINISGTVPIIGPATQNFLQDGPTMGTLTLNRFFGVHVWLMPAALVALVGAHLMIFRHNGAAGPAVDNPRPLRPGRFWPDQMFMDTVASFLLFAVILLLSVLSPAPLDAKADPTNTAFVPYPAWYFLALFGLLGILPPWAELLGTIILPGLAVLVLFSIPWIDRSIARTFSSRRLVLNATVLAIVLVVGLSIYSQVTIVQKQAEAAAAMPAANPGGGPMKTAGASSGPSGSAAGQKIFSTNCASCHGAAGQGLTGAFPPLAKNSMVAGDPKFDIHVLLYGLQGKIQVNGGDYNGQMPAWKGTLSSKDIAEVISYIRSQWGNQAKPITEADVEKVPK